MSSSDIAVSVRGLSKAYLISHGALRHSTAAEAITHRLMNPLKRDAREKFWALKDVDFDIQRGEVVGIIGRNGAGKSTLLKILSRITEPTTGEAILNGRVGSLLEVGTGFSSELTGRENIFLNGAILGMTRREITRQFDAIVDFAGVDKFLDTPVKRYSSGMYVRLAFAVAAHLNPEILIVDEVLAVGDAEFQKKCLGKLQDVAKSGRTVLFVSHNMAAVRQLCKKGIFLERGCATYRGEAAGAIETYLASFEKAASTQSDPRRRPGTGELRFTSVTPGKDAYECAEEKVIRFTLERLKPYEGRYYVSTHIVNDMGTTLLQCDSRLTGFWLQAADKVDAEIVIKAPWLKPGAYRVDVFICSAGLNDKFEGAATLNVIPLLPYDSSASSDAVAEGMILADYRYSVA